MMIIKDSQDERKEAKAKISWLLLAKEERMIEDF